MIKEKLKFRIARGINSVASFIGEEGRYGVPKSAAPYLADEPAGNAPHAQKTANPCRPWSESLETLAFAWMALEAKSSILITGAAAEANLSLVSTLASLVNGRDRLYLIQECKDSLNLNLSARNTLSIYGKGYGGPDVATLLKDSTDIVSDRIVVDQVSGREASALFLRSCSKVPFLASVKTNENGLSVVGMLLRSPFRVNSDHINSLDLSMCASAASNEIFEYRWLSMAETEAGILMGNGDSVSVCRPFDAIKESKTFMKFGNYKGLSSDYCLKEFASRKKFLQRCSALDAEAWKRAVYRYESVIA